MPLFLKKQVAAGCIFSVVYELNIHQQTVLYYLNCELYINTGWLQFVSI